MIFVSYSMTLSLPDVGFNLYLNNFITVNFYLFSQAVKFCLL